MNEIHHRMCIEHLLFISILKGESVGGAGGVRGKSACIKNIVKNLARTTGDLRRR